MKFTKKEISLCRQVAEKERRKIELGSWIFDAKESGVGFVSDFCGVFLFILSLDGKKQRDDFVEDDREYFPLWTISDCLEFLREKGYRVLLDENLTDVEPFEAKCYGRENRRAYYSYGDSYLEACLKAVLSMLEEEK